MSSLDDLEARIREAKARCRDLKLEQLRGPVAEKRIRRVQPDETLEKLISGFTELSFVRELVENSVDAGATRIDVSTDWEEMSPDGPGVLRIFVQDDGSGMDREAIDTRLTRLFSDPSRPGRHGIGFVSVFAFQPEAVIVDTGEWRVLFHGSREKKFERIVSGCRLVGTRVVLIKMLGSLADFMDLRERLSSVLRQVARYSEVPTFFEDVPLAESFSLTDAGVHQRVRSFELVVEPSAAPAGDFYARGILISRVAGPYRLFPPRVRFRLNHPDLHKSLEGFPGPEKTFLEGMRLVRRAADQLGGRKAPT